MSNPNVDIDEIKKFSKLAEKWWDPNGMMKSLHAINPLRLRFILDSVALSGKKALDIGCGCGILTESLAQAGAETSGIDLSVKAIHMAHHHAEMNHLFIDYRFMSAEDLAQTHANTFDVITCMEVLEHIPDPASMIQACARLLKPGGSVFFSTINRTLRSYLCAIFLAENVLHLLPKGTHAYSKLIRPSELTRWAQDAGLKKEKTAGIAYHLISKTFSLTKSAHINYIMEFRKA